MAKVKIPATRPKWTSGNYTVLVGDEHQGYFRTFTGAWHWRNYLKATQADGTVLRIQEHGRTINIHTVGVDHGNLLDWAK